MRVLVTGAGGFVCRSIVAELLAAGHEVVALDLQYDAELRARWEKQVTLVVGEVDMPTLSGLTYDAYIHGAALTAMPQERGISPIAHLRANLDPLLVIVEAGGPDVRGILISSDAAFRETRGPISEEIQPLPLGTYAIAKRTAEFMAETLCAEYGYNLTAIRLGNIYGIEERGRNTRPRVSRVGRMLNEAQTDGLVTVQDPDAQHDWTLASDVGRAVCALLAAETWPSTLYNVASGEVLSNREVAEAIRAVLPDLKIMENLTPEPPHPRSGHLVSERLRDEIGFDDWTPFEQGVRQILQMTQAEA